MSAPLDGIRILDLSRLLPGGAATRLLADLGAEVIKVERPGVGDDVRMEHPMLAPGVSAVHQFLDSGKRSVTLDLKDPEHVAIVLRLSAVCDAVIESFRPGVAERLGVGPEAIAAHNPRAVYVSLTGYGQDGPRAPAAGHDIGYESYAGVLSTVGADDGTPVLSGVLAADMMGGTLAATAILAGILRARSTGVGGHVDLSLQEAAQWAIALPMAQHLAGDIPWEPGRGPLNGAIPCYRIYRCADGRHLAVGALEQRFWDRLVALIGRDDLSERRLDPSAIPILAEHLAGRTRDEWLRLLEHEDTCVAPVNTLAEAAADPHLAAREFLVDVEGDGWSVRQPGCPVRFVGDRISRDPAPALGGDSEWVASLLSHDPSLLA
jgi:crotonobetainyl-CoA:carnitine CoA-transferase CaiB-like acyl-CoA transferase